MSSSTDQSTRSEPSVKAADSKPARIVSVDALRGFDMLWIIGAGSIVQALSQMQSNCVTQFLATQLTHVRWEGFRFFDLIFPLFLFIVGVSMVFSLEKSLAEKERWQVLMGVLRRSILLFVLGVLYYGGLSKPWPDVQLAGVLQRIAACYFGAAAIYCFVRRPRGLAVVAGCLLVVYWALVMLVPFPDLKLEKESVDQLAKQIGSSSPSAIAAATPAHVHGVLEEGRNLTNYVDFRFLPGKKAEVYYVNEGLLSTIPALALPLFGALAGLLLRDPTASPRRKVLLLLAAGIVGVLLGLVWSLQFPLIKRIWTSSFILLTAGLSSILLAVFYYVVDVRQHRAWCQPFIWIGCNAITIYLTARFVSFRSLAELFVGGDVKRYLDAHIAQGFGSLVIAVAGLLLAILFVRFLFKRNIFLRV